LVLSSRSRELTRITDEAASEALKAIFVEAAQAAQAAGEGDMAATLSQASTHWLRHSMLTNHANNGVQLKTLQDTAGHASIATTAGYLHKADNERYDEIVGSAAGKGIIVLGPWLVARALDTGVRDSGSGGSNWRSGRCRSGFRRNDGGTILLSLFGPR
jgi:hypothetical protein